MAQEKLIEVKDDALFQGLYLSAEPTAGQIWKQGRNIWFRDLSLEQLLGKQKIVNITGRPPLALAQAFNFPNKSLYWENLGLVYQMNGVGNPPVFGAPNAIVGLATTNSYWLEPWGRWLLMTDGQNQPSIWQGGSPIPIGVGQFATCQIIKKIAQFAVAYNLTGTPDGDLPNAFAWSDVSDPTNWTPDPTNAARNLTIRDLDSEIVCVADLGISHAVYSRDTMLLVQYVGPDAGWLGTPNQALRGIGAVSKHSVVSVGRFNYGISRAGIFATDGNTFNYADRPAIDRFLQENVDWSQASTIWGYWDDKSGLVKWIVPLLTTSVFYSPSLPRLTIGMDPKMRTVTKESIYLSRKPFMLLDGLQYGGMEREVFDYPITVMPDGLYYDSVENTLMGSFNLQTHLLDAGEQSIYKLWDYAVFTGTFDNTDTSMQMAFGFTDQPTLDTVEWASWQPMRFHSIPVDRPRESLFMALRFQGSSTFKMTSMRVFGEKGGFANG